MLLAIEGVPGAGKSTLQSLLLREYEGAALIEDFENHPYLGAFFARPKDFALEKIMLFLFMGYHVFKNLNYNSGLIISDSIWEKIEVFASADLTDEEWNRVFLPSYQYLSSFTKSPDVIVRLIGSHSLIMNRIRERDRVIERTFSGEYLSRLMHFYDYLFSKYSSSKVIEVDLNTRDFLNRRTDLQWLMTTLESNVPSLTRFRRH
jgi:deoxyadenosine/deoxycytidine kinase